MAINFVRQPSETPNVRNIDDIVPFRYAYGNQNGYVKDKGNELSYTVNGSNFRINSGRVVLFGVESDIDANGVTITVDNVATTRYYSVYYHVNLSTNTTSIESTYSTEDYPTIPTGDDLTANTSGTANLELYRFEALYGVINNVNKIVQRIVYTDGALNGYDTTKGTIEERLTNLGFREGDVVIHNTAGNNITLQNAIKKQGKYVYCNKTMQTRDFCVNSSIDNVLFEIPEGFEPKNTAIVNLSFTKPNYSDGGIYLKTCLRATVLAGSRYATFTNQIIDLNETAFFNLLTSYDLNFGWETN